MASSKESEIEGLKWFVVNLELENELYDDVDFFSPLGVYEMSWLGEQHNLRASRIEPPSVAHKDWRVGHYPKRSTHLIITKHKVKRVRCR